MHVRPGGDGDVEGKSGERQLSSGDRCQLSVEMKKVNSVSPCVIDCLYATQSLAGFRTSPHDRLSIQLSARFLFHCFEEESCDDVCEHCTAFSTSELFSKRNYEFKAVEQSEGAEAFTLIPNRCLLFGSRKGERTLPFQWYR